jgi:hypothetical protein
MKRLAMVMAVLMTTGCILSMVCERPVLSLLFALGAGAVSCWIDAVEHREWCERMRQKFGGDWDANS